jgi:formylglycine-generating enzyme required for sulfatase activity
VNAIFISYRRDDSKWVSGLIHERLAAHFGSDAIFTDIDSIPLGVNFKKYIDEQVGKCDIFLAVIGEKWLSVTDDDGRPRLKQPGDFVRLEIESALKREIPVIPLLVDNIAMPPANQLPKSLRELALRNGTPIRSKPAFDADVGRLIRGIEKHLGIQVKAEEAVAVKAVEDAEVAEQPPSAGGVFRDTLKDGTRGPEMVVVPAGNFLMGSPEDEPEREDNESPQHPATFAKPFAIGKYTVTFDEYDRFCESTGRELPKDENWGRENRPVIHVSWEDAAAYASWLSLRRGKRYRLRTEAEWEYAARAGSETAYWWGDEVGQSRANYLGCGSQWDSKQSAPVGSFPANDFGVHDTAGNVWEWVQDCWHDSYTGAPSDGSAWEEADGGNCDWRVLRGGSWLNGPGSVRSALRNWGVSDSRDDYIGFRLAQDL